MEANSRYFIELLSAEYARRKKANSRYSLRGYARHLEMDASLLSRILAGKHSPSISTGEKIAAKLKLTENQRRQFLISLFTQQNKSRVQKLLKKTNLDVPLINLLVSNYSQDLHEIFQANNIDE